MTYDGYDEGGSGGGAYSKYAAAALFAVVVFSICDMVEDYLASVGLEHLIIEAVITITALSSSIALWLGARRTHVCISTSLRKDLLSTRADALHWRNEAEILLAGLGVAIEKQFDRWNLSEAERDIGALMLKGFSHKEIALLRGRSERTVRQQAASLYQKSSLENRAQFSAFFLEDLLHPLDQNDRKRDAASDVRQYGGEKSF